MRCRGVKHGRVRFLLGWVILNGLWVCHVWSMRSRILLFEWSVDRVSTVRAGNLLQLRRGVEHCCLCVLLGGVLLDGFRLD